MLVKITFSYDNQTEPRAVYAVLNAFDKII